MSLEESDAAKANAQANLLETACSFSNLRVLSRNDFRARDEESCNNYRSVDTSTMHTKSNCTFKIVTEPYRHNNICQQTSSFFPFGQVI